MHLTALSGATCDSRPSQVVGGQEFVCQGLIGHGRNVVVLQPRLDGAALVGEAVGGKHRVAHHLLHPGIGFGLGLGLYGGRV